MFVVAAVLGAALGWSGNLQGQETRPTGAGQPASTAGSNVMPLEEFKDVVYAFGTSPAKRPGGPEQVVQLKLDLLRPKGQPGLLPCIVYIHGGGWAHGQRQDMAAEMRYMAERGFVTATISYRLAPEHLYPAAVQDCQAAIRFLRANHEQWQIDPQRMGALGVSAGGHLSMMLGTLDTPITDSWNNAWVGHSSKVQAVVNYVGPSDFLTDLPDASRPILANFMGGTKQEKVAEYALASPISHVDSKDAPMLLFHGTKDPLVPLDQGLRMLKALDDANVPGRVELMLGLDHGLAGPGVNQGEELERARRAALEFFRHHLQSR